MAQTGPFPILLKPAAGQTDRQTFVLELMNDDGRETWTHLILVPILLDVIAATSLPVDANRAVDAEGRAGWSGSQSEEFGKSLGSGEAN